MSSGFDQSYYTNHVASLYDSSKKINEVDTFLFNLSTSTANSKNIISKDMTYTNSRFKSISNIAFNSEDPILAEARANLIDIPPSTTSTNTGDSDKYTTNIGADTTNTNPLTNLATNEYVRATINYGPSDLTIEQINSLKDAIYSVLGTSNIDTNKDINKSANVYMRNVFTGASKFFYMNTFPYINDVDSQNNYYNQARYYLKRLSNSKKDLLFGDIADATKLTLYKIVKAKIEKYVRFNKTVKESTLKKKITEGFIKNLINFNGPLYYKLRIETIKAFDTNSKKYFNALESEAIRSYFKMIAVDLYIKTAYSLIVYDYISCLTETYIEQGDFINARLGVLAKVIYTYYFVNDIYNINTSLTASTKSYIENIVSELNNYLVKFNDTPTDHHIALHKKSNKVVSQNETVQSLSMQIKQNQLAMRNVIYNTGTLRKQYKYKIIELIILILTLIIIITVSCVLLFLETEANGFKKYVLYICGITVLIILILSLAKIISNIVKKSY